MLTVLHCHQLGFHVRLVPDPVVDCCGPSGEFRDLRCLSASPDSFASFYKVIGLIPAIIMSIWKVPNSAKYFSYFISFAVLGTAPPIFAWLSDMTPHDAEMRALLLGFGE
jgi:hypothetical protein